VGEKYKTQRTTKKITAYIKEDNYWCDCPIGSGRFIDELKTKHIFGIDKSPTFLEQNKKKY